MSQCSICSREQQSGAVRKIYTARELKKERGQEHTVYGGGREVAVTTTYGEFQEHRFFVCAQCITRRDRLARWLILGGMIALVVALGVISSVKHAAWAYLGALIVFIAGGICSDLVTTDYHIKGLAKRQRGAGLPVEAFNERRFRKLVEGERAGLQAAPPGPARPGPDAGTGVATDGSRADSQDRR